MAPPTALSSPRPVQSVAMNVQQFRAKWQGATLKERSASQEHFLDLCRLFGVETPAVASLACPGGSYGDGADTVSIHPSLP
jgi:hypothetical protein